MESKEVAAKLSGILEAIAAGRSCEQILADDRSLTYHDIFHAVAEAPTCFWEKAGSRKKKSFSARAGRPSRSSLRHRAD
jgi:hypothetical protein